MTRTREDILKNLTVLFVEDEDDIRVSLEDVISDEFKLFIAVANGRDGIREFLQNRIDIIITDISMPLCNGLEMAKEIKAISKDTPIIILSAYSDKDKLISAIDIGIDKFLIKPVDPDELLDIVSSIAAEKLLLERFINLYKDYKFDKEEKLLYKGNEQIKLTKKELLFVTRLIESQGVCIVLDDIKKDIWGSCKVTNTVVRTLVKRLRAKTDQDLIVNIPGQGYKIEVK